MVAFSQAIDALHRAAAAGSETGACNSTLLILLGQALQATGQPLKLVDRSTGFRPAR